MLEFLLSSGNIRTNRSYMSVESLFNDTHRENLCFTQFITKIATWLLLTIHTIN